MSGIGALVWLVICGGLLYLLRFLVGMHWRLRRQLHHLTCLSAGFVPAERAVDFTILDPYASSGDYYKVQLHVHTSNSRDVRGDKTPFETLEDYRRAGYDAVAVTDHDTVTDCRGEVPDGLIVIPGMERTIPHPIRPLGRHLLLLGVGDGGVSSRGGALIAPAHPSWQGNFETGTWILEDLWKLGDFRLIEIYNEKSDTRLDIWLWHRLIRERGPANPVWGIAVDDSDNGAPLDRGWVMVKAGARTIDGILAALARGSFYATTGPLAEFGSEDGEIVARSGGASWIRFIGASGDAVAVFRGGVARYRPQGDEAFVRVEVAGGDGRLAWSAPFFLQERREVGMNGAI